MRIGLLLLCLLSVGIHADIKVQGHRGARALMPENTLAAFNYALASGVDVLELDLGVSKDNALVISHEPRIDSRLCMQDGRKISKQPALRSLTLAQIKEFDCGSRKHPGFNRQVPQPGERMPTLRELFTLVKSSPLANARTVGFNVETKIFPRQPELTPTPEQFARLVVDAVREFGWQQRVVIQSFDYRTLKWAKKLAPEIKTSQLTRSSYVDLVAAAKSIQADYISPNWQSVTADMVIDFHANNIKVAAWTANNVEAWQYLVDIGVDEIITDDPRGLITFLREQGLR